MNNELAKEINNRVRDLVGDLMLENQSLRAQLEYFMSNKEEDNKEEDTTTKVDTLP